MGKFYVRRETNPFGQGQLYDPCADSSLYRALNRNYAGDFQNYLKFMGWYRASKNNAKRRAYWEIAMRIRSTIQGNEGTLATSQCPQAVSKADSLRQTLSNPLYQPEIYRDYVPPAPAQPVDCRTILIQCNAPENREHICCKGGSLKGCAVNRPSPPPRCLIGTYTMITRPPTIKFSNTGVPCPEVFVRWQCPSTPA